MTSRGIRNNNPGNIKDFGIPWNGLAEKDRMTAEQREEMIFCVFTGPWWGIRAIAVILKNYSARHGLNSIHKIISRWAPGSDNNQPAKYALYVAEQVGVSVYETIDVLDYGTMRKLVAAIVQYENGADPYTWEYNTGLIMAGIEPPA